VKWRPVGGCAVGRCPARPEARHPALQGGDPTLADLVYLLYRLLGAIVGPLPPRIGYGLAGAAGGLIYRCGPRLRAILTDNMRHVLGHDADPARVQQVVRQLCVNIAKGHYELFHAGRMSSGEIKQMVHIEGWEHVDRALAEGRGMILTAAHLGNVEIVLQFPLAVGLPCTTVALRTKPERLFRYAKRLRESHGLKIIPSDESMLGLFRALKQGEVVFLACDRAIGDNLRVVDFFGFPTRLSDGPIKVALRTGAPLLPVFAKRLPDNSFQIRVEAPLSLVQTGDWEADVASGLEKLVRLMESYISQTPDQWLVAVPIWPMEERKKRYVETRTEGA